ncbi:hypothetical protein WJX72_004687 [[Myrmecia] bisecta]|uniref:RWP-RK domain-containing protein n=1 Tax=[Myrmecia] bisecta TaxID=41462 RepID=A0AAW1QEZ8_9CHLO
MPIAEAAKALGMSLSSLKNLAHEQGVHRWPYRSRQSLRVIIEQTKQHYLDNGLVTESGQQLQQLLDALEDEMNRVGMGATPCLSATTKRFRQMVFKLNHTRKTMPGMKASVPADIIDAMTAAIRQPEAPAG